MRLTELYNLNIEEIIAEREKKHDRLQFRQALRSRGLTMTKVAKRTKQHLTTVSRHATNTRNPGFGALKKYSEIGISPSVFGLGR